MSLSGLSPYIFTNQAPAFGWIRSINSTRDGTILAASVGGLFCIKDGGWTQYSAANGLPASEALWACQDSSGVLWVGLVDGMARIEGTRVDSWTEDQGLFDDYIRAIIPDDNGWLWFDSSSGIFRVRRDSFVVEGRRAERLKCEAFDGMDSVKTLETSDVELSACKTADGRIWMPSPQGIILIDPARMPKDAALPAVSIEKIRINGQEWSRAEAAAVAPGRGELEVQYTAPTFIAPKRQQFRYRLEGYEKNWELAGARRSAFFTNLKPGKYRFLVQACCADGAGSGGAADSFDVELLPFFYQTAWFYGLCGALGAAGLFAVYRLRVRFLTRKQREMQATQERLEMEVRHRTAELKERTVSLEKEIEDRKQMEREVEGVNRKFSVNTSAALLSERVRNSRVVIVGRVAQLLKEHGADLNGYLSEDPKGRKLPAYLDKLSSELSAEQADELKELAVLNKNVEHIKVIVAMQQSYAKMGGVTTAENVIELVEDSLRMNQAALERHEVRLVREYEESLPRISVDRHKVMQILLNLVRNAKYACDESGRDDKQIILRVRRNGERIAISVIDNGVGILPENLERIFSHGFTTRKGGHGFGLHSGALAAKDWRPRKWVASCAPKAMAPEEARSLCSNCRSSRRGCAMEVDSSTQHSSNLSLFKLVDFRG